MRLGCFWNVLCVQAKQDLLWLMQAEEFRPVARGIGGKILHADDFYDIGGGIPCVQCKAWRFFQIEARRAQRPVQHRARTCHCDL